MFAGQSLSIKASHNPHPKERGKIWKPCLPAECCIQSVSTLHWLTSLILLSTTEGWGILSPTPEPSRGIISSTPGVLQLLLPPESPCSTTGQKKEMRAVGIVFVEMEGSVC